MTTTPEQIASELDGLIDSLDEHVSHEDISRALGELRDSVRAGLLGGDPTEKQIEAVARELACLEEGDPWPTNAQLGGSLTGDRDMEYRSGMREQARGLLLIAARAAGVAPQARAKDLSTSPGDAKNQADSFNVAPQEPDECGHEAWEETGGSRRCSDCKEWVDPQEPSETDERIIAWEAVADHEVLKSCYAEERPLLPAVLDRLTMLADMEVAVNELAPALSLDREKLIAEAEQLVLSGAAADSPVAQFGVTKDIAFVRGVRWALDQVTTPPAVDADALAEVTHKAMCGEHCEEAPMPQDFRATRAVAEYLRGVR